MKSKFEIDPKLPEEWAEFHVHELTPKLQQVVQLLEHDEQIWGYADQIVKPLALAQIISLNSQAGKIYAMTEHGSYQVKKKLYEVAELLSPDFVKISRSEFVNLNYLDHLELSVQGTIALKLKNGTTTFVARRCVKNLKERLGI